MDDQDPRGTDTEATTPDPEAARGVLEAEHEHLAERLAQAEDPEEQVAGYDENFADSGQVAAEQGEAHTMATQLREQLADVEAALARLEAGTYGTCELCNGPIGADRLEAMPATRWCIEHAP